MRRDVHTETAGDVDLSTEWYRKITDFALEAPSWLQETVEIGTDAVFGVFALFFLAAWWRARPGADRAMALALLAPVAMTLSYLASELLKILLREARPCWPPAEVVTIAQCPEYGDWSLPSNHSTAAAGAAVALAIVWRRTLPYVLPLALLAAASRVFVGAHYPHDVVAGLLLGTAGAALVVLLLTAPATSLVRWARERPALRPLLAAGSAAPAPPERR